MKYTTAYTYDELSRLDVARLKENGTQKMHTEVAYSPGKTSGTTTTQLSWIRHNSSTGNSIDVSYEYDANGNITCVIAWVWNQYGDNAYFGDFGKITQTDFHYDTANQLVREDNAWLGKTFVWTYDNAGNITSRQEYAYANRNSEVTGTPIATYTYTYGDDSWGDLLTAYNGIARTYDNIGNVLTDGTWTYTWQNGRELASMTDGTTTWNYTYDANGMRTSRSNGSKTYNYVYNGSQLVQMTVGNDTLYFTYGLLGPTTVTWNGATYYYALDIQGNVVAIFDEFGNPVVTYNWDNAWGYNPQPEGSLANTLGTLNPLRYRSYVYDTETGYYYLQSRYYDPKIGRFVNADALVTTGQGLLGNNMFTYCLNNPTNYLDPDGNHSFWIYLMMYSDWGFVHRQVQAHILATSPLSVSLKTEVTLENGRRADVVNMSTGAAWEIKHGTHNISSAQNQMSMYVGQTPKAGGETLVWGEAGTFSGEFYVNFGKLCYLVHYSTPEPGVIIYTIEKQPSTYEKPLWNYAFVPKTQPKTSTKTIAMGIGTGTLVLAGAALGLAYTSGSWMPEL